MSQKMGFVSEFTIRYTNIKHALRVLKNLKAKKFDYYRVDKVYFKKGEITGTLIEKKYPYCPWGSNWYSVELNERIALHNLSYRSAGIIAWKVNSQ